MARINTHLNSESLDVLTKILLASGWTADKKSDISDFLSAMENNQDWPQDYFFPLAKEILSMLRGIHISGKEHGTDDIRFFDKAEIFFNDTIKQWREVKGVRLFPLAISQMYILYIGDDGVIYGDADVGSIEIFGRDVFEGIYNFLNNAYIESIPFETEPPPNPEIYDI